MTTTTMQDIKAVAQALRDEHATTCAMITHGADCFGWQAKASHFKGRTKGTEFRTLESAAAHCRDFGDNLAALRSKYMQISESLGTTASLGYAMAFGINPPTAY